MKITYLYHSGFSVELETCVLLFDYYKGNLPRWEKDKPILVFVSHKHADHFSFIIFDLLNQYEKVQYFLGSDIRLSERYLERNGVQKKAGEHIVNLGKHKKASHEKIQIETLCSTDAGVAFVVEAEGKCIYHAGDLNWWHWEGESDAWNKKQEQDYRNEMKRLAGRYFDVAFVPLDPRLEKSYDKGMNLFLEMTDAKKVFPMHMWEEYNLIQTYKKSAAGKKHKDKVVEILGPGQEFLL